MKPQKIAVVQEDDDSSLDKATTGAKGTQGGKIDYAKVLQDFAEMKEELEKIPTKYDKNNKSKDDTEEYESQENLEVNLVKTMDARDPNDETENMAYTEPSKQEPSEENEAYEEDFEKSNEVNEDVEQNEDNEEDKGNKSKTVDDVEQNEDNEEDKGNKSKTVDDAEVDKSSVKEPSKAEESEEKYGEEEFENDEDQNERKSDKKEQKAPQPVVAKGKPAPSSKDVKKPPVSNSKTQSKEPPKPQPKLAQTVPNKNFKIKSVTNANTTVTTKEVKETKKEPVTLPPKDPKKPTMSSTTKPATGVKPPLKRPSTATVPGPRSSSKPKEETKPKEEKSTSKIDEDLEVPEEEENIAPNESAKPVAEKKLPPVSQRKSLKKKEESAPAEFEVEDTMGATESQAEPEPVKKRPASALPKSGLSKTQSKAATSSVKVSQIEDEGEGEGDEDASKTQGNNVRIRKVKKLEPKDMMKQIFEEYKKKENQSKQKDEKIFVIEETDKKVKGVGAGDQKQAGDQENNWIGTGVGVSTAVFDAQKKKKANEPKTTAKKDTGDQGAQGFAQKFLASLGAKIGKSSAKDDKAKESSVVNESTTKEKSEKPPKGKEKEAAKKDQGDGKDKNWKYAVGEGVDSEYAKKQKEKEQEYKKKFTDLFSKEKAKQQAQKRDNVQKLKEVMQRERDNQKAQQETLVKNMRGKNQEAEKKEDRESKVLQVQNIYLEESERNKQMQQKDEINQLKLKLKLLKQQNDGLEKDLADVKHKDSDASKLLDSLASKKAVILLGKTDFTPLGLHTQPKRNNDMISPEKGSQSGSKQRILPDEDLGDKISTVEKIVNKFADQGFTLEQVYHLLDQNGDNLLTVKEIKEGLEKLELDLQPSEIQELISILDRNSDGTITAEEFVTMLQDSMKARREYKNIMGDLDQVLNPIVLEERMLDISIRRKIIEEDMKKEADSVKLQEHEYKKVLRRLQEYEGIAGPQEEKKVDLDVYRDNILKLKIEIQDAEDIKSRTLLMQGERMKDINENIQVLEDQIEKTIRRIHNEKSRMKDLAQLQQKEKIKDIFMKKAFGELEREINKFDNGIDQHVQKMLEEKQRVQVRIEEDENQNAIGDQMMNGAAVKLQKVYRGSIARKKNKQDVFALLRAKNIILKKYRSFKSRTKAKTVLSSLEQIRNRRVRYGWVALKANLREKREDETKEKQRQAEERKKQRIEEQERARRQEEEEQERQRRMQEAQSYSQEHLEESKENLDASVASQTSELGGKKVPLYTVLYLQDVARKSRGVEGPRGVLYNTKGEIKSCKICNKNPVERVCKECEVAVFCAKCFDVTHRSRKNHQFIEVESQSKENDLLGKILREDEQTFEEINMIKAKYKKDFTGLLQHFKDWDVDNKKSFEAEKLREVLRRKVREKEDLDFLIDIGKYYCSVSQYDSKIDYVLFGQLLED